MYLILMKSLLNFLTASKLFKYFKKRYKKKEIKLLNDFVSLKGKIRTIKTHIKFLKSCLQQYAYGCKKLIHEPEIGWCKNWI